MKTRLEREAYSLILAAVETARREWRDLHGIRYVQIETTRRRRAAVWSAITDLENEGVIDPRKTVEEWRVHGPAAGDTTPRIFVCWNGHDETGRGPDIDWRRGPDVEI